jgi:hypothetical protein
MVHRLFRLLTRNVGGAAVRPRPRSTGLRPRRRLRCPSSVSICGHRLTAIGNTRRSPTDVRRPSHCVRISIFSAISIEQIAKRVGQRAEAAPQWCAQFKGPVSRAAKAPQRPAQSDGPAPSIRHRQGYRGEGASLPVSTVDHRPPSPVALGRPAGWP